MKFTTIFTFPIAAVAALQSRQAPPVTPSVDGLNKALDSALTFTGYCFLAVEAFYKSGVIDTSSLETSCVPLDTSFAEIEVHLNGTNKLSADDLAKTAPALQKLFASFDKITTMALTPGVAADKKTAGDAAILAASCKVASRTHELGETVIRGLQRIVGTFSEKGVEMDLAKKADTISRSILDVQALLKLCGNQPSASSSTGITLPTPVTRPFPESSSRTGITLPPPVTRPFPESTSSAGSAAPTGTGAGATRPSGIVTAGAAGVAPRVVLSLAVAAAAVCML